MSDFLSFEAKIRAAIEKGFSDTAIKTIKKNVEEILVTIQDDIEWRLKDDAAYDIQTFIVQMSEKAVKSLLEGNEAAMLGYLEANEGGYTGRSTGYNPGGRDLHPIIHGTLFEYGGIALRKKIVDAHSDLLKTQRILDLEDQVKSLVEQVNEANRSRDIMYERCKGYL